MNTEAVEGGEYPESNGESENLFRSSDWRERQKVALSMAKSGSALALQLLMEMLTSNDSQIRKGALIALGEISHDRTIQAIIDCFDDIDEDVQMWAAYALSNKPADQVLPILQGIIFDEKHKPQTRATATWALHYFDRPLVVDLLIQALEGNNSEVRQSAIDGLGSIGDLKAVQPIIAALKDADMDVRWLAASALGKMDDKRALEPLIEALRDESDTVRVFAAISLGYLEDPGATTSLRQALDDNNPDVRLAAQRSLERLQST